MSTIDLGFTFGGVLTKLLAVARRPWAGGIVAGPRIQVTGCVVLTPAHSIHVVELDGRRLVVGCHSTGMLVLNREPVDTLQEPEHSS
jgi:flagellar biogenesis protein FliO